MPCNLLLVDDSAAIRKILQRVLQHANLIYGNLYEAGDGLEALEIMRSERVDLILTDIQMPKMDGFQLLKEVKEHAIWKNVPVVMIAGDSAQGRVMEAAGLEAAAYLWKPFTPEQIQSKLSDFLR